MSKRSTTSSKRQRRLTLFGVALVFAVWTAALALLLSQPGAESVNKPLPTLASPVVETQTPETAASVNGGNPTLMPTSLPVEAPPGSQPNTSFVSSSNQPAPIQPLDSQSKPNTPTIPSEPV